ncbi:hypothetical protein SLA2020_275100 [Shorea laevis]
MRRSRLEGLFWWRKQGVVWCRSGRGDGQGLVCGGFGRKGQSQERVELSRSMMGSCGAQLFPKQDVLGRKVTTITAEDHAGRAGAAMLGVGSKKKTTCSWAVTGGICPPLRVDTDVKNPLFSTRIGRCTALPRTISSSTHGAQTPEQLVHAWSLLRLATHGHSTALRTVTSA